MEFYTDMEVKKSIIHSLGEIRQEEVEAADMVARALLASDEPRTEVRLKLPGGGEIEGFAFGRSLIVTDEFIATTNSQDKIDRFLPRNFQQV